MVCLPKTILFMKDLFKLEYGGKSLVAMKENEEACFIFYIYCFLFLTEKLCFIVNLFYVKKCTIVSLFLVIF